jgi:ionotropic glutamate receptor
MPFQQMINELEDKNGTCDVGLGSITITSDREDAGIEFTYPYMNTGLGILVSASGAPTSGWNWIKPFSVELWIAVLLTIAIFPAFIFIIEFGALKRRIHATDVPPGLVEATWRSIWTLIGLERLDVTSLGAKITAVSFGFVALILVNTYTANLAAVLTVNQINSQINSVYELRGKAFASNSIYLPRLRSQYGIIGTILEFNGTQDVINAAYDVLSGAYAAVITDEPYIQLAIAAIPDCQVIQLPDVILPFSYGVAFKTGTNSSLVDIFSSAILALQEDGDLNSLSDAFFAGSSNNKCNSVSSSSAGVSFESLYGLWVLLGCGTFVGLVIAVITRWRRRRLKRLTSGDVLPSRRVRELTDAAEDEGSPSSESRSYDIEAPNGHPPDQIVPVKKFEPQSNKAKTVRFSKLQTAASLFDIEEK